MSKNLIKVLSIFISFCLILEQPVFAQAIDLSHYFARNPAQTIPQSDKFRPLHLRYILYDNQANDFKILLDKGDFFKQKTERTLELEQTTKELMKYFFIGLSLPNEKFWVNLRPDSPDNILDPELEKTDIGRIFLEADLQLKKDTASFTSPQNPEGKAYWNKLYKKAGELFGSENITIPTITRPWIVPNEIIIREAPDNAYIYKATLKVMLEEDYLIGRGASRTAPTYQQSAFSDPRLKELNEYSTQLIKETIIPKLTYAVNTAKRYAPLRQVYYSLILAQWFKQKYGGLGSARASGTSAPVNSYIDLIDSGNLANLTSKEPYDKQAYFQQYQKSFKDGEYHLQEPVYTPMGQSIRRYMSGGVRVGQEITAAMLPIAANKRVFSLGSSPIGKEELSPAYLLKAAIKIRNETGQEGLWLPQEGLHDKDGNPITNKGAIMRLPKKEKKIITDIPLRVINQYGVSNKKITVIAGFDEKRLRKVIEWVKKRRVALLSPASNMNSLIIQFLEEMEIFTQREIDGFESWLKGKGKNKGKGKRENVPGRIVREAVERIEYLLYPDEEILPFLNLKRRVKIMNFLFSAYGLKNIQTHRSIDLLITLLEKGTEKADYGPERTKIKVLLAKTDRKLFSGEDLARIKKIILKTKELPEKFLGRKRAVNMLQKDDEERIKKITPWINKLEQLSDFEWSELIRECAAIGWPMLYGQEIDKLPFPEENKFGMEFEYFGKEEKNNGELRIPADEEGFKNTASNWKKVEEELLRIMDEIIASFHNHINRSELNTLGKRKAVIRIAKALEAFWYRLGPRGDVPQIYLDRVAPISFGSFFRLGGVDFNHFDIASFSSRHNTVEFRFFRAPIRGYTAAKAEFDLSMLQDMVAIAMQIVNASARKPGDFTLINTGLPRLLGMGNSLISSQYIRTAIERLYRDDLMGKIRFIRFFFNKESGFDWRKESDKDWIEDEKTVEEEYNKRELGFLYRLHKKKGGWDSNIYQTLRDIIGEIENNHQLISDYGGIEEFLSWMMFNGETEEEVRLGEEGIKRIQGEDYLYILKNVRIVPDILDIPLVKQRLNDSRLEEEEKLIEALNILSLRLIEQVMLKFEGRESEFMRLAELIREIPDQQKKAHCALSIVQRGKYGFHLLPWAIGIIAVNLSDENKEAVISGLSGYIAAHPGLHNMLDFIRTQADIVFSLNMNNQNRQRHILDFVKYAQDENKTARSMIINVLENNWVNLALPLKNDILLKLSGYLANEDHRIRESIIDTLTGNIILSPESIITEDPVIMSIIKKITACLADKDHTVRVKAKVRLGWITESLSEARQEYIIGALLDLLAKNYSPEVDANIIDALITYTLRLNDSLKVDKYALEMLNYVNFTQRYVNIAIGRFIQLSIDIGNLSDTFQEGVVLKIIPRFSEDNFTSKVLEKLLPALSEERSKAVAMKAVSLLGPADIKPSGDIILFLKTLKDKLSVNDKNEIAEEIFSRFTGASNPPMLPKIIEALALFAGDLFDEEKKRECALKIAGYILDENEAVRAAVSKFLKQVSNEDIKIEILSILQGYFSLENNIPAVRVSIVNALVDIIIRLNNEETRVEYVMGMVKNINDEKLRKPVCDFLYKVEHTLSLRNRERIFNKIVAVLPERINADYADVISTLNFFLEDMDKISRATLLPMRFEYSFEYHTEVYLSYNNTNAERMVYAGTECRVLDVIKNEETQEVWVKIQVSENLPGISISVYSRPQVGKGQEVWYRVTKNPNHSFCLRIGKPPALEAEENKSASSSLDAKGGIAFNSLPIQTESVVSSALGVLPGARAFSGDLDAEWARIQDVFNVGIRPSIQRLSEYTAAAVASPLAEDKIDPVRVMLADILRRDEENEKLAPIEESCKQLLMALENGTIPT